ncbi:MAG: hypothetical protein GY724_27310, partial [Actinomycetia bacterium]|nr:hypothetical protein [Actinomycetes bacterium]
LTLGVDDERFSSLVPQAKLIPGLEIVELDAGHAVNAHDPIGWNQAVIEFITRSR